MSRITEAVRDRIYELSDEFGVHPSIVRSLYDIMPNELYDGIVNALEDYADYTDDTSAMTEAEAWDAVLEGHGLRSRSPEAMSDPENTWRKNGRAFA